MLLFPPFSIASRGSCCLAGLFPPFSIASQTLRGSWCLAGVCRWLLLRLRCVDSPLPCITYCWTCCWCFRYCSARILCRGLMGCFWCNWLVSPSDTFFLRGMLLTMRFRCWPVLLRCWLRGRCLWGMLRKCFWWATVFSLWWGYGLGCRWGLICLRHGWWCQLRWLWDGCGCGLGWLWHCCGCGLSCLLQVSCGGLCWWGRLSGDTFSSWWGRC